MNLLIIRLTKEINSNITKIYSLLKRFSKDIIKYVKYMKIIRNYFKGLLGNIKKPNPAQPEVLIIIFIISMLNYDNGMLYLYRDYKSQFSLVLVYVILDKLIGINKFSLKRPLFLLVIIILFLLSFIITGLNKSDLTIYVNLLVFTILLCIKEDTLKK